MTALLIMGAALSSFAWIAVFAAYWRRAMWEQRRNPLSLAIAVLMGFVIYGVPSFCWVLDPTADVRWILGGLIALSLCACGFFAWAFHAMKSWYPDDNERRKTP